MQNIEVIMQLLAPYFADREHPAMGVVEELIQCDVDSGPYGDESERRADLLVCRTEGKIGFGIESAALDSKLIAGVMLGSIRATPLWLKRITSISFSHREYCPATPLLGILIALTSSSRLHTEVEAKWLGFCLRHILCEPGERTHLPSDLAGLLSNLLAKYIGEVNQKHAFFGGSLRLKSIIALLEGLPIGPPETDLGRQVNLELAYKCFAILPPELRYGSLRPLLREYLPVTEKRGRI